MKIKFTSKIGDKEMYFAEKIINGLRRLAHSNRARRAVKTVYLAALEKGAI